jgi:hypothetical protein
MDDNKKSMEMDGTEAVTSSNNYTESSESKNQNTIEIVIDSERLKSYLAEHDNGQQGKDNLNNSNEKVIRSEFGRKSSLQQVARDPIADEIYAFLPNIIRIFLIIFGSKIYKGVNKITVDGEGLINAELVFQVFGIKFYARIKFMIGSPNDITGNAYEDIKTFISAKSGRRYVLHAHSFEVTDIPTILQKIEKQYEVSGALKKRDCRSNTKALLAAYNNIRKDIADVVVASIA